MELQPLIKYESRIETSTSTKLHETISSSFNVDSQCCEPFPSLSGICNDEKDR